MMKITEAFCIVFLLSSGAAVSAMRIDSNPLGRVLDLMDGLAAKVTKEGEVEAKAYGEFVEWCDNAAKNTRFEIKTATAKKEKLDALIGKSLGDADIATAEIEKLAASVAAGSADLKDAAGVRKTEEAEFAAGEAELVDTGDTLSRAISTLSKEMAKNPAAFAQVDTTSMDSIMKALGAVIDAASFSGDDRKKLTALVQSGSDSDSDDDLSGSPAAAVYKTKSGRIVDVLEDMKEKAEEQLSTLRKAETNAKHNYASLKQSLDDQLAADNKDLAEQKRIKSESDEARAQAEGDLERTVKELVQANQALDTSNSDCMQTAADHEATVAARNEELAVIAKAREIVSSSSSGAVKQSYSLFQKSQKSTLNTRTDLANAEVVSVLKRLALKQHSVALAQLASRIAATFKYGAGAGEEPFSKIKGLITDMISKLQAEAKEEATEKAWCDEQMAKTTAKKEELSGDVSKLQSKINKATFKSAELKEEVSQAQADLAEMAREQAEATKIRNEENANYRQAKKDLELGLNGVQSALSLLREYYGGAAALVQQPTVPEHSKSSGAGQSIIGILEVCESDFAKELTTETTEEDDAASSYEKMMQQNKVVKITKEQDVKYKSAEGKSLAKTVAELTSDRTTLDTQLSAVLDYDQKIKAKCIAKPESYEERKARREAEVAGLKDALNILENEAVLMQRGKRSLRGVVAHN